jgi:hypothetical protein
VLEQSGLEDEDNGVMTGHVAAGCGAGGDLPRRLTLNLCRQYPVKPVGSGLGCHHCRHRLCFRPLRHGGGRVAPAGVPCVVWPLWHGGGRVAPAGVAWLLHDGLKATWVVTRRCAKRVVAALAGVERSM